MGQFSATAPEAPAASRRSLLKFLLGFSFIATLAGVLAPIIGYLWPPRRQTGGEGGRVRAASLAELQVAGGLVTPVENQPIVLTFTENAGVRGFSAICTHLGCVVRWHREGEYIECPCHDGRFNSQTGAVISGPPPSPLPPRDVAVEDDDIYVYV